MLTPSKKIFYLLEAVLYIAYNAKEQAIAEHELCKAQDLPPRYLEPMLQKLVRAGVLRGVRGPQGGYMLGRERRRISLADIAQALAEPAEYKATTELGDKILVPAMQRLNTQWQQQLASVNVQQLCDEAVNAKIPHAKTISHDFTI